MFKKTLAYLVILLGFISCDSSNSSGEDIELARVYDNYLYASDVENLIPENTSASDSIVLVKNFVNNWVRTTLMAEQAKKNLTPQQQDFNQQLEDYRNSLIIFSYEKELINQKLDTVVTEVEIEAYYQSHLRDFQLKENISRAIYVVIDYGLPEEDMLEKIFKMPDSVLLDSLETFSMKYASSYHLDTLSWLRFSELQKVVPIDNYSRELFKRKRRFFKLEDQENTYMLKFVDFKIKDDTSPLEIERIDIRSIIVNKRKLMLVKKVRSDIYNKALQNDEFEIF